MGHAHPPRDLEQEAAQRQADHDQQLQDIAWQGADPAQEAQDKAEREQEMRDIARIGMDPMERKASDARVNAVLGTDVFVPGQTGRGQTIQWPKTDKERAQDRYR
jgi:hypothetical protein